MTEFENKGATGMGDGNENNENKDAKINVKVPKRVLHFSDGTIEEYSSDEEDQVDGNPEDVKESNWLVKKMKHGGSKILHAVDYVGEGLAEFLGITTPKYILEIEEHKRRQIQNEIEAKQDQENDWRLTSNVGNDDNGNSVITNAPETRHELPEVHKF